MVANVFASLVPTEVNIYDLVQGAQIVYLSDDTVWCFDWDAYRQIPIISLNDDTFTLQHPSKEAVDFTVLDALHAIGYRSYNHNLFYITANEEGRSIDNQILQSPLSSDILVQIKVCARSIDN